VDGGGLFREFLSAVLIEGFNPDAGIFTVTPDRRLYAALFLSKQFACHPRHTAHGMHA
jgi:hypothetical protein